MTRIEKLRQLNKESYEVVAPSFDASRHHPWRELGKFAREVRDGEVVLDLGCGNGRLLKALPKVNFEYLGIDSNAYLLAKAHEAFPGRAFVRSSLEDAVLDRERYDHIFCVATLHHLATKEDRVAVLKKCYEALKPEGKLVVAVWNLWQREYLRYLVSRPTYKIAWNDFFVPWKLDTGVVWRYYHGFTVRELQELFLNAGFRSIQMSTKDAFTPQQMKKRNYIVRAIK